MHMTLFLPCMLILLSILAVLLYYRPAGKTFMDPPVFFNRLQWKLQNNEMTEFTSFLIDVYCFKFDPPLPKEMSMAFTEFAGRLDMKQLRSVMILFVWLYQHGADFRLTFRWNRNASVRYNMKNLFWPRRVRKLLLKNGHDDIMSCPLDVVIKNIYGKERHDIC